MQCSAINAYLHLCWPRPDDQNSLSQIQLCAGHSESVPVNPTPHIFVISQPKWMKFGLQSHLHKMFFHRKFQLSITCTFRVTKLLVEVTR